MQVKKEPRSPRLKEKALKEAMSSRQLEEQVKKAALVELPSDSDEDEDDDKNEDFKDVDEDEFEQDNVSGEVNELAGVIQRKSTRCTVA